MITIDEKAYRTAETTFGEVMIPKGMQHYTTVDVTETIDTSKLTPRIYGAVHTAISTGLCRSRNGAAALIHGAFCKEYKIPRSTACRTYLKLEGYSPEVIEHVIAHNKIAAELTQETRRGYAATGYFNKYHGIYSAWRPLISPDQVYQCTKDEYLGKYKAKVDEALKDLKDGVKIVYTTSVGEYNVRK